MKLVLAAAAIMALLSMETVFGYHLDKLKMKIMEDGMKFEETIYVDKNDNYEIISVPNHNGLSALVLVNDFKHGHSIYKVADDKTCYVVPLSKNEEKPSKLKKSVEKVHGDFPLPLSMCSIKHS